MQTASNVPATDTGTLRHAMYIQQSDVPGWHGEVLPGISIWLSFDGFTTITLAPRISSLACMLQLPARSVEIWNYYLHLQSTCLYSVHITQLPCGWHHTNASQS